MSSKIKKITIWTVSIVAIGGLLFLAKSPSLGNPVSFDGSVDAAMVQAQLESEEATLLDVRTPVEYDLDHAPNSLNHNLELMKKDELPDLDKGQRVYVYCRSGNRSAQAMEIMKDNGFTNVVDLGGLQDWVEGGGELVESEVENYLTQLENMGQKPIQPLGPEDADTVAVKYSDFSCPYCARYTLETEALLLKEFVFTEDPNVRYEFRNYTYLGDESAIAANGGYCANEQELFWPFHDAITQGFSHSGDDYYTNEIFTSVIEQLGGDQEAFRACAESDKYATVISAETIEVKSRGINSTPTLTVGDQKLEGALPYDAFRTAILSD